MVAITAAPEPSLPTGHRPLFASNARVDPSLPVACRFLGHAAWPRGTLIAVVAAIREVADLTGLTFGYAPTGRPLVAATYVRFSVRDRHHDRSLGAHLAYGRARPEGDSGGRWIESGDIVLARDLVSGPKRRSLDEVAAVVMRELGHVLGLAHNRGESIMCPNGAALVATPSDREAFAWLGAGPIRPRLGIVMPNQDGGQR